MFHPSNTRTSPLKAVLKAYGRAPIQPLRFWVPTFDIWETATHEQLPERAVTRRATTPPRVGVISSLRSWQTASAPLLGHRNCKPSVMALESSGQPPPPCPLPRPQQVFDPTRSAVPTKAALEAKARQDAKSLQPMRPPPRPLIRQVTSLRASTTQPEHLLLQAAAAVSRSPLESPSPSLGSHKALSQTRQSPSEVGPVVTLGTFTQDGEGWDVRAQRGRHGLLMVKSRRPAPGLAEKRVLDLVSHENIVRLLSTMSDADLMELSFEYARFTLAQILHVHLRLEERHIQCIAHAVSCAPFSMPLGTLLARSSALSAIWRSTAWCTIGCRRKPSGLRRRTYASFCVSALSRWFRRLTAAADFGAVTESGGAHVDNSDLKDLGFVLLECMEGHALPTEKHSMEFIAGQRAANRVFGLTDAEQWSGCKEMVDFLDELFNENKTASAKYSKPVSGLQQRSRLMLNRRSMLLCRPTHTIPSA